MSEIPFTRRLEPGSPVERGPDVEAIGRALCHAGFFVPLRAFTALPRRQRRSYGRGKISAVNRLRKADGRPQNGVYDLLCHEALVDADPPAFKPYEIWLLKEYEPPLELELVHPVALGYPIAWTGKVHPTGGLPGYPAIDFAVPEITGGNGAPIVACEAGTISRLSGHDPNVDTWDRLGVYGWSTYVRTAKGREWYYTHLGKRNPALTVGSRVKAGDVLGWIGDQAHRPDHLHAACSSPLGWADAEKRIIAASKAPRVAAA